MPDPISPHRKFLYYLGITLIVLGFILFLSVFVSAIANFGNFDNFQGQARSSMMRAVIGIVMIITGGILRTVGARGIAGSGVILNPRQARNDLKPYTRMAGGMVRDALDSAEIQLGGKTKTVVMIKCRNCGKLNEEDSKFCQECGKEL
ncbi:MAG: zinc ribbon domain-containing protein [Puniceicoccales bacterium]